LFRLTRRCARTSFRHKSFHNHAAQMKMSIRCLALSREKKKEKGPDRPIASMGHILFRLGKSRIIPPVPLRAWVARWLFHSRFSTGFARPSSRRMGGKEGPPQVPGPHMARGWLGTGRQSRAGWDRSIPMGAALRHRRAAQNNKTTWALPNG